MIITKEEREGKVIVRSEGRLDAMTVSQLENFLNDLVERKMYEIALDFGKIEYLSSAGMRLLLSMSKRLKKSNGHLMLFAIQDDVMEIIRMAGFEQILSIYPDERQAIAKQ
ncbi:MAG: STAS domain-containing protein [Verrucomicrobia bacterium]|jgi:anti-anti-sigma factor|nr:STAS domain-containing protein [Verrucomicrobiota bacterium]